MPKSIDLGTILRVFYEKKKKKTFLTISISACEVWGGGGELRFKFLKRNFTHIYLDYGRIKS